MDGGGAALGNLLFFGLLLLGIYFLVIRPQRSRARTLAQVRSQMGVGSTVMTTAGIHATVAELDGDSVLLEVAPGVRVRFASQAVVRLLDEPSPPAAGTPETDADGDPAP